MFKNRKREMIERVLYDYMYSQKRLGDICIEYNISSATIYKYADLIAGGARRREFRPSLLNWSALS